MPKSHSGRSTRSKPPAGPGTALPPRHAQQQGGARPEQGVGLGLRQEAGGQEVPDLVQEALHLAGVPVVALQVQLDGQRVRLALVEHPRHPQRLDLRLLGRPCWAAERMSSVTVAAVAAYAVPSDAVYRNVTRP